jgi:hypothetical protein
MKAKDVFPSTWLAADDLGTARPTVTITRVGWAEFSDGTKKRAVWFEGKDKGLSLNVTNWNTIAELTGEDDDDRWIGKRIRLFATKVTYAGKMVSAIRVEAAPSTPATRPSPRPVAAPPPPPEHDIEPDFGETEDEQIPF